MSSRRSWIVSLASRAVPRDVREEVVADLEAEGRTGWRLAAALWHSGRDARRIAKTPAPHEAGAHSGTSPLIGLAGDIRVALRQHARRPAAAAWVVVTLALATGVNLALFTVVQAVLLKPLPFSDPDRIVFLWNHRPASERDTLAPARALDLRRLLTPMESAALIGHISMTVAGRGPTESWYGASVSSNFFDVLGATPALGRVFHAEEPDRELVVLSHRLWVDRFGADPEVIGTPLIMNGRSRVVVGVMGSDFFWPSVTGVVSAADPPLFWTAAPAGDVPERAIVFDEDVTLNRHTGYLRLVARLRDGATLADLAQAGERVTAELGREHPLTDGGVGIVAVPAREQLIGSVERPLWLVWLFSALVVVGAAVTVANLILVRQRARRREFALRAALGAGRARVARQCFAESLVLAAAGGLAGLALAAGSTRAIVAFAPRTVGRLDGAEVDSTTVLMMAGVVTFISIVFTLMSMAAVWRRQDADGLRGVGVAVSSGRRLRSGLVAAEVAVALALLVGAALFGSSLLRLQAVDVGFDTRNLLTFDVSLKGERAEYQSRQLDFFDRLVARIRAMPGVRSAAGAVTLPVGGDDWGSGFFVEGRPLPPVGEERRVGFQIVGDGWFDTLGIRVLRGRDFTSADIRQTTPVVLINQTLAEMMFPDEDPIGRRVKYARQVDAPVLTVIGVVSDIRHLGPSEPARPEFYQSYRQSSMPMMAIAVRTEVEPHSLMPMIRAAAAEIDSTQPLSAPSTMDEHLSHAYGDARFLARLTTLFGGLALLLAVIGVYGVTSVGVAERTREFGVRTALGARPRQLSGDVVRWMLTPVAFGAAGGLAVAWVLGQASRALLFDTAPLDPSSYATATVVLLSTALAATWVPAVRAARIDPVRALRDE